MAGGMTSIYIGVSGVNSAQIALNTTTHNLSNVYTPGYTRQLSFTSDRNYNNVGYGVLDKKQVGLGVQSSVTSRVRDILLDKSYRTEYGRQGFYEAQSEVIEEIETILGETEGVGFRESLDNLWSAFNEMSKTPDNIVSRSELVMYAEAFISRAQAVYTELTDYQKNLDTKILATMDRVNELGDLINEVNIKIAGVEAGVENANDLRDKRDTYLDELSNLIKVSYTEETNGYVSVMAEGVPFVTDGGVYHMETRQLDGDENSLYVTCVWPYLDDQEVFLLEQEISTNNKNDVGMLKGYLLGRGDYRADYTDVPEVKDYDVTTQEGLDDYLAGVKKYNGAIGNSSVAQAQALFDKLVNGVVTTINDIFSPLTDQVPAGVTTYTDADGNTYNAAEVKILDMTTSTGDDGELPPEELFSRQYTNRFIEVTGDDGNTYYVYNEKNVFDKESLYTLSNIDMNQVIREDYSKLPFRTQEGDNDLQKGADLVEVWNEQMMTLDPGNMAKLTFKEYYRQMVYTVGNKGNLYNSIATSQKQATDQIDEARTVITGVSSEEELTNMIKFQGAYNASSRYVTAVAEMLEYIIDRLGG